MNCYFEISELMFIISMHIHATKKNIINAFYNMNEQFHDLFVPIKKL